MLRLLHLSDLHFGPPYLPRLGDAVQRLAPSLEADAIVVSGDLTQRAKREQFEQAREFLDRLPSVPRIVVPGNHDVPLYRVWERLTDPHGLYREHISEELDHSLTLREKGRREGAVVVAIDTTAPLRTITRGQITQRQIDRCEQILLDAPPEAARVVVVHHHFVDAPDPLRDQSMRGGRWAMKRFMEIGVDLILGGHLHRAFIGNSLDFFFKGPRDRGIILVQSGTSTSRRGRGRERERNTLNVVDIHRTRLEVTHYLYFEADDTFGPMSRHLFPRRGHRLAPDGGREAAATGA